MQDGELIKSLVDRDEQAYEILLDKYEIPIYRFFYYSHGNCQLAQDQCGETFARFVTGIKNFRSNNLSSLKAFIFAIAKNVLLESYRQKKKMHEDISGLKDLPSSKPTVFQEVSARDELDYVLNIIEQFKEPEKQILLLRFAEDLALDEIADIMSMPLNTVKNHIFRCRQKLMQILSRNSSSAIGG